jgi:hypothetical protein
MSPRITMLSWTNVPARTQGGSAGEAREMLDGVPRSECNLISPEAFENDMSYNEHPPHEPDLSGAVSRISI